MATLNNGTATITPEQIDGYDSVSEAGTIVDGILGSEDVAVTLRPAGLRTGTMRLVMGGGSTGETDSRTAENLIRGAHVWTLVTGDRGTVDMTFVVRDRIRRILDPDTRNVWLVEFGWQEVAI